MRSVLSAFASAAFRLSAALTSAALVLAGCSTVSSVNDAVFGSTPAVGTPGHVRGFLGGVVSDEPQAALAARTILSAGGTAADAAVALAFVLTVTMPSRAGLGGGGACMAYDPDRKSVNGGVPEAILFLPSAPGKGGNAAAQADRPAAIPALARGLFALHARYGKQQFDSLISAAEQMARFGSPVSRAFAADLALVSGPLFADPAARRVFSKDGVALTEGQTMLQPDLGSTLAQLRVAGVGDLYQGALARRLQEGTPLVGGPLTVAQLRTTLPQAVPGLVVARGNDRVAFLPPPADGGLAAAAAFQVLLRDPAAGAQAQARAAAVAARWRSGGGVGDPQALLAQDLPPGSLPAMPASASFLTLDREGRAVACTVTMNNLFGTGRIVPGTGMLLAASPASVPPPLLSAAIAWNDNLHGFRAAVTGTGQAGAPLAVAAGMLQTLRSGVPMPAPVPDPGRANVIACSLYLPDNDRSCGWAVDPRSAGIAVGSN